MSAPAAESFEQLEARLDATLWSNEVLAVRHEAALVDLRDRFRRAANKVAVLAGFDFDVLSIPVSQGPSVKLGLGVSEQHFDDATRRDLPARAWRETLSNLAADGWRVEQAEWNHERFVTPATNGGARSEFSFHLHGERPPATRFILEGRLGVEWDSAPSANGRFHAHRLVVSNLVVLERGGKPGFARTAVVTPNAPERRGDMVNLHPLIVTDLDGDGNDDVILGGVNQFFRNPGDARFQVTELVEEKLFQGCRSAGVLADFNGDGWPDFLAVGGQGAYSNKLVFYPGNGALPFSRPPVVAADESWIVAPSVITAGDIDGDGDLDVFLAQYKPPGVGGQMATPYWDARDGCPAYLLVNDGSGHFSPAPGNSPLWAKRLRRTFAASFADLDGDGDLDLITVNDFAGVDLYDNDGHGQFSDVTARLHNSHLFGMAHSFGDFDGDGALDVLVAGMNLPAVARLDALGLGRADQPERTRWRGEMAYGNRVYLRRDGRWANPPFADALARTGWTWGNTAGDFDNNGDLDFYFANGHISGDSVEDYDSHYWRHDIYLGTSREDRKLMLYFAKTFNGLNTGRTSWMGHQHNQMFLDFGSNHYRNAAWLMDVAHETDCRAVVSADLNNDGKLDLLLTDVEWTYGPSTGRNRLHVHLNQLPATGHWIEARLSPLRKGVSPIGAKIFVKTADRVFPAQIVTGHSYQSQHPFRAHFGLGRRDRVEELVVQWPNGETNKLSNPKVDACYDFGKP